MKKFQVISKPGCHKCDELKEWLKKNDVKYEEWSLQDSKVKNKLLNDDKFITRFCDIDGCMVYTPVIRIDDSGEYFFKELFGVSGLRVDALKKIIGM